MTMIYRIIRRQLVGRWVNVMWRGLRMLVHGWNIDWKRRVVSMEVSVRNIRLLCLLLDWRLRWCAVVDWLRFGLRLIPLSCGRRRAVVHALRNNISMITLGKCPSPFTLYSYSYFSPFYRIEQVIVYPRDQTFWTHTNRSNIDNPIGYYGPAFRSDFLLNVCHHHSDHIDHFFLGIAHADRYNAAARRL